MSLAAGKGTSFAARAGRVSGYAMGRRMGRGAVGDGEGSRGGVMLIAWQRVIGGLMERETSALPPKDRVTLPWEWQAKR